MSAGPHDACVRALRDVLTDDVVLTGADAIVRVLKDNSWLSPVLLAAFDRRVRDEGPTLGVAAVVAPADEAQLVAALAVAAEHRTPITPRGSGTSNFGLVTPARGGLVLDLRRIRGAAVLEGDVVRAPAGTLQIELERAARAAGRELTLLTTTYASATVGGWIAGGHVGLGSSVHGSVWDANVVGARVVSVEEHPRVHELDVAGVGPLLHTSGTVGVVTEVAMPTVPARDYVEAIATFATFEASCAFVRELSIDETYRHRVVTAQEGPLLPAFRKLPALLADGVGGGVMMIVDATQVAAITACAAGHGGSLEVWQAWDLDRRERPSIAGMVYGHRMLWVKKQFPDAAFLHVYFDPDDPMPQVRALKARFGDGVLVEMKEIRSAWLRATMGFDGPGSLPASVITVRDGDRPAVLADVMAFCGATGIPFQNPHVAVLEDSGLFRDLAPILACKRRLDPHGLLNPGKLRAMEAIA